MNISFEQCHQFQEQVWQYYAQAGRHMPWRDNPSPYNVLVSELMLQQTQVARVIPKFQAFVTLFPDFQTLANANLRDVLAAWSGLGYNRRAKFLQAAAKEVIAQYGGTLPADEKALTYLPGIGPNTAGAILAYAFNQPVVFIETNIRTVYFHHFFATKEVIDDKDLRPVIAQTLDTHNPREWYWALMDYGAYLKHTAGGHIQRSRHYIKQSTFKGSERQLRGQVLRQLLQGPQTLRQLQAELADERLEKIITQLQADGLISYKDQRVCIA